MKRLSLLLALLLLPLPGAAVAESDAPRFRILVFTKTEKFRHTSIDFAVPAVQQLGAEHNFEVDHTERSRDFNDANLAGYDAVMFLSTTGNVLNQNQQAAFRRYITSGGGFVGVHAAADTEYKWPFYGKLLGAWFEHHPKRQNGTIYVSDKGHPSTAHLPTEWKRFDEWYNYRRNPRGRVHVLMTLDERSFEGGRMGADHPIAWCQDFRGGRSWYTGLGHTDESYSEPEFLAHLLGGIETAAGAVDADCSGTVWDNFNIEALSTKAQQPTSVAPAPDGSAFFLERTGRVQRWDPASGQTSTALTLGVRTAAEDGLLGIALDPQFETTGWVYLYYSPQGKPVRQHLARFTFDGEVLDPASEAVLLEIPVQRGCCHSSGSLTFDFTGNLFLSTGDDTDPFASDGYSPHDQRPGRKRFDAQRSAANTNDLRGKILRITPEEDGTYSIPEGNLFEEPDENVRPEIYAMGLRNPFRLSVDPDTGTLYFADIGPDARKAGKNRGPRGLDEWNRTDSPGNFGWPYCVGKNRAYRRWNFKTKKAKAKFSCSAPVNRSPNSTGLEELPPSRGAWFAYPYAKTRALPIVGRGSRAAMAGPHFPRTGSAFPAYYDGALLMFDWARGSIFEVRTDENGLSLVNPFLARRTFKRPIDLEMGADGALYLLDFGMKTGGDPRAGLYRITPNAP